MVKEITTEVLANAIDATKKTVRTVENDDTFRLDLPSGKQYYTVVNKIASNDDNQLNAMAIAPVNEDGTTDYNNVAIVYAGTNMPNETGKSGFGSAVNAFNGNISEEYKQAEKFLNQTQKKVAQKGGSITDVAGFSQSGGYMMKMAGEHGQKFGFRTTSFDDWGKNQFNTLTYDEQQWLKKNPEFLIRYQNDSWANASGRDRKYGTVSQISGAGFGEHSTLAKYFDGDTLNLDRLAKDGIFAPNMTLEQVKLAAKVWAKKNSKFNPLANDKSEAKKRVEEYLELYGKYAKGNANLTALKSTTDKGITNLQKSIAGASGSKKIELRVDLANAVAKKAKIVGEEAEKILKKMQQDMEHEISELSKEILNGANEIRQYLSYAEVQEMIAPYEKNKLWDSVQANENMGEIQQDKEKLTTFSKKLTIIAKNIQDYDGQAGSSMFTPKQ